MPTSYTILFGIIIVMAVLTFIIPAGKYETTKSGALISSSYHQIASHPQGIWDVFMAPIQGLVGNKLTNAALPISLFILMIGGYLGVINQTKSLNDGIAVIVKKFKGKEKLLIPILMTLFALGGSTYGMAEETLAIMPLLIPVMMAVGFDSIVAISIILIGTQTGVLASTINPFSTGVAAQTLGISVADGILPRMLLWVILVIVAITFVYRYAAKIEKDPSKSVVYLQRKVDNQIFKINEVRADENVKLAPRQKVVLGIYASTFVIMITGIIPWTSLNPKWTFFESICKTITNTPFVGAVIGKDLPALGTWYYPEMTMLFFFMSVMVMLVSKMSERQYIESFLNGMKDFLGVAMIVALARGIQVIMNDGYITDTILHAGQVGLHGVSASVFVVLTYILYIPMSFLIPSSSGLASATIGLVGPMGHFAGVSASMVVTAFQTASGLVALITPTSGLVMGALSIAHVDLAVWWKYMVKLIAAFFMITVFFLLILSIIK
ncbi:YfcC family protein [Fructilactobacillus sp. Tb1]|uniref:YfcC family protein n=1 Tax=Fructilactobacillus sp. Tb1 TaxID=3422304 RepID=UPI003D2725E3